MSEWQDIETAPTDEDFEEIIVTDGETVCAAVLFEGHWIDHFSDIFEPTKWQPLPPPPENT